MFIQQRKKLTQKQVEKHFGHAVHYLNYLGRLYHGPNHDTFKSIMDDIMWRGIANLQPVERFGKPIVHMRDYESNPGVWIFKNDVFAVEMVLYSDCHRKNAYKGTSFELLFAYPNDVTNQMLTYVFEDIRKLLCTKNN